MYIPGFDPKMFTDDEIVKKMQELSRRIAFANRFSSSPELAGQLQNMMNALEFERRERIQKTMFDMREQMFPDVIETEPDLKVKPPEPEQQDETTAPRKSKRPFGLAPITKTTTPRP